MNQSVDDLHEWSGDKDPLRLEGHSCDVCEEDTNLVHQIHRSDSRTHIAELNRRRWDLRTRLNKSHDPFIHKLPTEIASLIFIMLLPRQNPELPWVLLDKFNPLLLGSVCQTWRRIAWTTPQLWTTLIFWKRKRLPESHFGISADWLSRSGHLPLTIIFYHRLVDYNHGGNGPVVALIDVLKRHSSRFRCLSLGLHPILMQSFCDSLSADNLRSLSLSNTSQPHHTTFSTQTLPNLTHLDLDGVHLQNLHVGWEKLTHLLLECVGLDECIEAIRRAPLLEWSSFGDIIESTATFPITNAVYRRDQLRVLEISTGQGSKITRALTLPALERWIYKIPGHAMIEDMISLFRRSSCQLKTLDCEFFTDDLDLVGLFQATPFLEGVRLQKYGLNGVANLDEVLERLSDPLPLEDKDHEGFLPRLRYMSVEGVLSFSWDRLYEMFCCSHRKTLAFKVVVGATDFSMADDVALRLLKLVDEGINLSLREYRTEHDFLEAARDRLGLR